MRVMLPKSAKEQKAWLKKLGINRMECARTAIYRDSLADKAVKATVKRDYEYAKHLLELAIKSQDCIEQNQNILNAIDKASRV